MARLLSGSGAARLAGGLLLGLFGSTTAGAEPPRGQPYIRTYPLDEIGSVPRGLRLGFDAFGRVAVMYDGIYSVLNDTTWVDRVDNAQVFKVRMTTIRVANGKYYYGGRGSWGIVERTVEGGFRAAPLVPDDAPAWTRVTPFNKLLDTRQGMYFYEFNGVVFWDYARQRNVFFQLPRVLTVFPVGDRVFVACEDRLIRELLPATESTRVVSVSGLEGRPAVEFSVALDQTHALLALQDGSLCTFDGEVAAPWLPPGGLPEGGKITAMERLVEGGVAIAIDDKGLFLFAADGTPRWVLTTPELRRTYALAAGEPGVLWCVGENAVQRIYYESPVTSFGLQQGIKVGWPLLAFWRGSIVSRSNGALYLMEPGGVGRPSLFRILAGGPAQRIEAVAASGDWLLAGTADGVFSVGVDGTFTPLIHLANVAGLQFLDDDTCLVFGSAEIAALRRTGGEWRECAPRIPGIGNAPIYTSKHRYVWVEMGSDQVARLTVRDGRIDLRRIELPWRGGSWTNVGRVGATVVLSGVTGRRTYYDEERDALCAAPQLDQLLGRSPYWLLRMTEDATGVLWASHSRGIVTFTPQGEDYVMDATTFDLRNDSYPFVNVLPGNSVWLASGRSLYHVERPVVPSPKRPHTALVSVVAGHHNLELGGAAGPPATLPRFEYEDSSLSFRLFSGTYAWRFPPQYEYRLGPTESWTPVDPSLELRFPKLRDGAYVLEMREARSPGTDAPPLAFPFIVAPPWYRTAYSYGACVFAVLLLLMGLTHWLNRRSHQRNAALERLVNERTRELEVTMARLAEETRNAATLAERSRLAGEIHDSIQQGLSGTILHLETTLAYAALTPELRAQLNVMRSMLSYSREEVQQAVWNLESPLLQNSTLDEALRKLASYINSGLVQIRIMASAGATALEPAIQHNLLRIAQEAITNAVKHASAGRIDVRLEEQSDQAVLAITDDGNGFDPAARSQIEGHFGLRGLRSRAKSIGARLEILSSPGAGTTIRVTVPLHLPAPHDLSLKNQSA